MILVDDSFQLPGIESIKIKMVHIPEYDPSKEYINLTILFDDGFEGELTFSGAEVVVRNS